jgi:hypothetical protein
VRSEMCTAYRAAVQQQLEWVDLRAAIAALTAIANLDQGAGLDHRLDELEQLLVKPPNGAAREAP